MEPIEKRERTSRDRCLWPARLLAQALHRVPDETARVDAVEVILSGLRRQTGVVVFEIEDARSEIVENVIHGQIRSQIDGAL